MNNYLFLFVIVVIFNYCFLDVLAKNNYYIVSIRRNKNDKYYDNESSENQKKIDEFVNERMNTIYDVIVDNNDTYFSKNGTINTDTYLSNEETTNDILNELLSINKLKKRSENNKIVKFDFIDPNRPKKYDHEQYHSKRSLNSTLTSNSNDEIDIEYQPIKSKILYHICPILNYYAVQAYLSDDIVDEIKKIPNVINIEKVLPIKLEDEINNKNDNDDILQNNDTRNNNANNNDKMKRENSFSTSYDRDSILDETKWKDVSVQENEFNLDLKFSHLSLISQ
eukprot:jgi/Orpsp1_1/1190166/evm.model.d7180000077128.1